MYHHQSHDNAQHYNLLSVYDPPENSKHFVCLWTFSYHTNHVKQYYDDHVLQIKRLKHPGVKNFNWGHRNKKWSSQDLVPVIWL